MTITTMNSITAEQVREALMDSTKGDNPFLGMFASELCDSALVLYETLNRDENGNPRPFDLADFNDRYITNVEGFLRDAERVQEIECSIDGSVMLDERAKWIKTVVWPRLSENERKFLVAYAGVVVGQGSPRADKLFEGMRGIRNRVVLPLLKGATVTDSTLASRGTVSNNTTINQVRRALGQTVAQDRFWGVMMKAVGESALVMYEALNRDMEGNPREFDLSNFYDLYLHDVNGLLNEAERIRLVHARSDTQLPDQKAEWIRTVVWPRLTEDEREHLVSHVRTVIEEATPDENILHNIIRNLRGQIRPLLMGEGVELPLTHQGGATVQDVVDAVEKAVAALNEVDRLVLVKTVKDLLFLYEQLACDENGKPKDFNVKAWYNECLVQTDWSYLDASRVRSVALEKSDFVTDERSKHVGKVWSQLDGATRDKLRMVALSVLSDYGPAGLSGLEATDNAAVLKQIRALVWPLVEKELGQ